MPKRGRYQQPTILPDPMIQRFVSTTGRFIPPDNPSGLVIPIESHQAILNMLVTKEVTRVLVEQEKFASAVIKALQINRALDRYMERATSMALVANFEFDAGKSAFVTALRQKTPFADSLAGTLLVLLNEYVLALDVIRKVSVKANMPDMVAQEQGHRQVTSDIVLRVVDGLNKATSDISDKGASLIKAVTALPDDNWLNQVLRMPKKTGGKKGKVKSSRLMLGAIWRQVEKMSPDLTAVEVRHYLLSRWGELQGGEWTHRPDIGKDEREAFESLRKEKSASVSRFRYELLNDTRLELEETDPEILSDKPTPVLSLNKGF